MGVFQGVGSHAAHLLLRSGVGHLRLVDFDLVTLSTLNRHAVATREDVGTPKATSLKKHLKNILPEVSGGVCTAPKQTTAKSDFLLLFQVLLLTHLESIHVQIV